MSDMLDTIVDDIRARWHIYLILIALIGGATAMVTKRWTEYNTVSAYLECPKPAIYLWGEGTAVKMAFEEPTDHDGAFTMFQVNCACEDEP